MTPEEMAAYVRDVVDQAPPLTDQQRDRLAALLRRPLSELRKRHSRAAAQHVGGECMP